MMCVYNIPRSATEEFLMPLSENVANNSTGIQFK